MSPFGVPIVVAITDDAGTADADPPVPTLEVAGVNMLENLLTTRFLTEDP
jgi:hypothetical protein